MTEPLVEVHDSAEALATTVAGALLSRLAEVQAAGREPQIVLAGGTIAEAMHRELARLAPAAAVDWTRVVVWWGDERFVAPDSPDRNALDARQAFLDVVGATQVHEMPSTADAPDVEAAAETYSATIREHGADEFEMVLLGVGPDGHVASLFPGHPAAELPHRIAVAVHDAPKSPPERVSLTFEALERARSVWFLVSGEAKADAVASAMSAGSDLPAARVRGAHDTVWFLDRRAAIQL